MMSMQSSVIGSKFVWFGKGSIYESRLFRDFPVNPYDNKTPITILQMQFDAEQMYFLIEFIEK